MGDTSELDAAGSEKEAASGADVSSSSTPRKAARFRVRTPKKVRPLDAPGRAAFAKSELEDRGEEGAEDTQPDAQPLQEEDAHETPTLLPSVEEVASDVRGVVVGVLLGVQLWRSTPGQPFDVGRVNRLGMALSSAIAKRLPPTLYGLVTVLAAAADVATPLLIDKLEENEHRTPGQTPTPPTTFVHGEVQR